MNKLEELFGLKSGDVSKVLLEIGINLLVAIIIIIIGFWLAKMVSKGVERLMTKSNTDKSLTTFIRSLVSGILRVLVIVTAITQLGVEMTSFVAILGAAGLAIGLAFSGTLSNFAGGVMILAFKPFKAGDYISTQNEEGIVDEVLIFNTILKTPDNKVIILPNGAVANGVIINFTKAEKRRVDWRVSISYGDDLLKAKNLLEQYIKQEKRILNDPEPVVALAEMSHLAVVIAARGWVDTNDYWDVFFTMNERIYNGFNENGLTIPHMTKDRPEEYKAP